MEKTKNNPTNKDKAAPVEQPVPNHTEKIKLQVLARIGKPPRLDRVEVCKQHNGKYRVNIWEQTEPNMRTYSSKFLPQGTIWLRLKARLFSIFQCGIVTSSN